MKKFALPVMLFLGLAGQAVAAETAAPVGNIEAGRLNRLPAQPVMVLMVTALLTCIQKLLDNMPVISSNN